MYIAYVTDRQELGFFFLNDKNSIKQFSNLKGNFYIIIIVGTFVFGMYSYSFSNSNYFETKKSEITICSKVFKISGGHVIPGADAFANSHGKGGVIPPNSPEKEKINQPPETIESTDSLPDPSEYDYSSDSESADQTCNWDEFMTQLDSEETLSD